MSFSLLSTKLYIPPARAGAIARPRLTEKLLSGMNRPGSFALLSGPAGFGKTTLLSEFAARLHQPVAWLSLDEADNDPVRFWSYLVAACQSVLPGAGESALELLRAPQPLSEDSLPTLLINDLAGKDQALFLILDDAHTLQNPSLHASLTYLLDHLPPNLHLIVSTRTDPPWPLSRYRARNQLIEIRAQELRFRGEEAAQFLRDTMGLDLSAQDLAALEERTEGWIAGLQLAALSMQGRNDQAAFIQAFTGSHAYVAEYLVDEVLKRQPEPMQAFLLQTSILDQLCGELCDAVMGNPPDGSGRLDGQEKLNALQQANIFIIPLDDERRWFRYHHLFADLLKARLRSSLPKAAIAGLHQRASGWYEQGGMAEEAIEHGLAAGDIARAVQLVEKIALPMIMQAHVRTVAGWLQAIPVEWAEKSPRINMACAWMNLLRGAVPQALPFIERLRIIFAAPVAAAWDASLQAEWLAVQAELLVAQGRAEESRDLAKKTQEMISEVDPHVRSMIYLTLAKAYQQTLEYERAAEIFQMIARDARQNGDVTFEILGSSGEAQMFLKQGRLRRTFEIASEAVHRLETSGKRVPFSATLYGELGQVYFHWRQFEQARAYQRRSMEITGKSGYSDPEIYFHIMQSKMALMEGDLAASVREIEEAGRLAGIIPPAMVPQNLIAQQVWVHLATNQPAAAELLLAKEGFGFGGAFTYPDLASGAPVPLETGLLYNSALRILLYHARQEPGRSHLQSGIDLAERVVAGELIGQQLPVALETLLLLSQMHAALGDSRQSQAAAARAIELAEPEGFISSFVEEGPAVAGILAEILKSGPPAGARPEFVRELLAAFPQPPGLAEGTGLPPALVEPLSARELEVLRLIAAGDSNQAIAEKLVITVSAVKKHTGNIYGKLGVSSRTQAVSRARQLGLLAAGE